MDYPSGEFGACSLAVLVLSRGQTNRQTKHTQTRMNALLVTPATVIGVSKEKIHKQRNKSVFTIKLQ